MTNIGASLCAQQFAPSIVRSVSSEKLKTVLGRPGVLVALVFIGTSMSLFCFVVVGAIRKELADQEARLSGTVYTAEQDAARRRRRAHRGWLLVLAVALIVATGPLLPPIS